MSAEDEVMKMDDDLVISEVQESKEEETNKADSTDVVTAVYASHGGDPRELDLGKCLLVAKLPSAFVHDSYNVFSECLFELLCEEFNINRDAIEKVIRIPKLQADVESAENALRAIVMFKSRVHKHRVFAQKKLSTLDGALSVSALEEIPREMLEVDEIEVADEVGEEEHEKEETHEEEETGKGQEQEEVKEGEGVVAPVVEEAKGEENGGDKVTAAETAPAKGEKTEEKPVKKAYIDEDLKAPFEMNWDGAPEFQWKLCTAPGDNRRLTVENLFYADLKNPFIYRVMAKAESVEMSFPMRFNIQGTKQMYGKVTMLFQFANQTMQEAISHLLYVRCAEGRRIKVYLPQTPQAMKLKDELEDKLGRVIQPTPRMHQLVLKVIPKEHTFTIDDAKVWFPEAADKITALEFVSDEAGQTCALVTFSSADAVIEAHSSHTFINVTTKDEKVHHFHVFMRGAEAHFGSLLTRWDQKRDNRVGAPAPKRPAAIAESRPPMAKRGRGIPAGPVRGSARGSYRGSARGGFSRGGRGGFSNHREHAAPAPFSAGSSMRSAPRYEEDRYDRREAAGEMWRQQQYPTSSRGDSGPSRFGNYSDSRRDTYSHGTSSYGYERR